jgi:prevent-host-death family protein
MPQQTLNTNEARTRWRDIIDAAHAGQSDIVIERYGKPMVVIIPYEDYLALEEELEELRAARRAEAAYREWKKDPTRGRSYAEIRAELVAEKLLDE